MSIARPLARSRGQIPALPWVVAAGDIINFAVFVAIGDHTHHESEAILHAIGVIAPFLIGWYAIGLFTGMFRRSSFFTVRRAITVTLRTWIPALLVAMLLRSIFEGRLVHPGFVIVAFLWNALFLTIWHAGLARYASSR